MADPGPPGWMAPAVVLSGIVSIVNFGWNVYNLRRGDKIKRLDHDRSVFATQVGTPMESSLTKFEEFIMSLGALDRQHARLLAEDEDSRITAYAKLQKETFEPAMAQFQMTLARVSAMQPSPGGLDWLAFEDSLDLVWTSFDTLCRHGCEPKRLKAASNEMKQAVQALCADLRGRMNEVARSMATL